MKYQNIRLICAFGLVLTLFMAGPAAAYTPPGGEGGGQIVLGESPATEVSITAPDDITGWVLTPGDNNRVGILKVSANGDWQVTATDEDTTNTNGYMTEWYDSSYVGTPEQLASHMNVSVESGGNISTGYEVELPTGGKIADGGSTSSEYKDVEVTFKQPVSWNDEVLGDGHTYRMVVTFTISSHP